MTVDLDHPAPYRIFMLTHPNRMVLDVRDHVWNGKDPMDFVRNKGMETPRIGLFQPNWSRLIVELEGGLAVTQAELVTDEDGSSLLIEFRPVSQEEFEQISGVAPNDHWQREMRRVDPRAQDQFVMAIDAGHGGIDPGAVRAGLQEKDLTLDVALALRDLLDQHPKVSAFLTRDIDMFVSLPDRVRLARAAEADVFVSLHANTVTSGDAEGAVIYTLSETPSDPGAADSARRENQVDLTVGVAEELPDADVSDMLMDMARTRTNARSRDLAGHLLTALHGQIPVLKSRPVRSAGFRVLRAPDVPSVLVELGFISNAQDRERMMSDAWRRKAANALLEGILSWGAQDGNTSSLSLK